MRKWLKRVFWLGVLVFAALTWLWFFPLNRPSGQTTFSVLSWNVHGFHSQLEENTAALVLEGIRSTDADILLFQEFPVARAGNTTRDELRAMGYTHEALFSYDHSVTSRFAMGMAIFSRYPISYPVEIALPPFHEGRLLGLANVEIDSRPLRLGVVHMPNSDIHQNGKRAMIHAELMGENLRTIQSAAMLEHLEPWLKQPLVVGGDFNTFPLSSAWRLIHGVLQDAFSPKTWGDGTFHIRENLDVKIDHIFHSASVRSKDARVLKLAGSDHLPVLARLQF